MLSHEEYLHEMIANRRALHKRPEEGWTEFETTWFVTKRLRELGLQVLLGTKVINPEAVMGRDPKLVEAAIERALAAGVPQRFIDETEGYTGCVAVLETGRPGPVTAIRCDMDCVLVTESDSPDHPPARDGFASERPGFMHACGHDAHTAVGLEVARWALEHKDELTSALSDMFGRIQYENDGRLMPDDGITSQGESRSHRAARMTSGNTPFTLGSGDTQDDNDITRNAARRSREAEQAHQRLERMQRQSNGTSNGAFRPGAINGNGAAANRGRRGGNGQQGRRGGNGQRRRS